MCAPLIAALPAITAVLSVAGTAASVGIGIAQSNAQAKAAQDQADFQADKARYDAIVSDRAHNLELAKDGIMRLKAKGRMYNSLAASNLTLNVGSASRISLENARFDAISQSTIAANASLAATGFNIQAQGFEYAGAQAASASRIRNVGLAIGGLSSIASSFTSQLRHEQRLNALTGDTGPNARRDVLVPTSSAPGPAFYDPYSYA